MKNQGKKHLHFYKAQNGTILDTFDLEAAYLVVSGHYRGEDKEGFVQFIREIEGKTIFAIPEPSVEELIRNNLTYKAVRLYRSKTGCTTQEATDHVRYLSKTMSSGATPPVTPMQKAMLAAQKDTLHRNA
jgi:hypothetical protein